MFLCLAVLFGSVRKSFTEAAQATAIVVLAVSCRSGATHSTEWLGGCCRPGGVASIRGSARLLFLFALFIAVLFGSVWTRGSETALATAIAFLRMLCWGRGAHATKGF